MKNVHRHLGGTQAQRTNPYRKQPYESRLDRALVYPACNKRESWQSDFCGVIRLAITNRRYWVNLWANDTYRLRLSEKDGLLKTPVCRLSSVGPGRYTGELALSRKDSSHQFLLHVELRETVQGLLEIHFETILEKEDR
jgi:hypothetical protein